MSIPSGAILSRTIRLQPCRPDRGGKGIAPDPFVLGGLTTCDMSILVYQQRARRRCHVRRENEPASGPLATTTTLDGSLTLPCLSIAKAVTV